jgi:TRAP-type C4-dicarboxylate transport system substrate-binding protein
MRIRTLLQAAALQAAAGAALLVGAGATAEAQTITLRIASGHPPAVVYAGVMKDYFQSELKKRVEAKTKYKINWVEGYGGSIVKVYETLSGVRDGIVDIGGFCFCFEPANLPLHAFQVMLPFGPVDPIDSLRVAQDVYAKVPYLTKVFEEKFNQKLVARITDASYNLGTNFAWKSVKDLKDRKIAGAGLNLNWLKYAGATPVQFALPEAYTGLQTRVYDGAIMFPSAWVNLKLHEPAPFYTLIGFGTITWHGLTINASTWKRLPKEVQDILLETAKDFEEQVGKVNRARYQRDIDTLRKLITVNEISPAVRSEWATFLKDWPQQMASELNGKGLPASQVLKLTLDAAEKHGHKWPLRYTIK